MSRAFRPTKVWSLVILGLATLLVAGRSARADLTFTLKDLGTLEGGGTSQGWALNDSGLVTGQADVGVSRYPFIGSGGSPLREVEVPGRAGIGYAIDSTSRIAGSSLVNDGSGGSVRKGFITGANGGGAQQLAGLAGGSGYSEARALSPSGIIAGSGKTATGALRAVMWDGPAAMARDLGRLDSSGESEALGINAKNDIVGWSDSFLGTRAVRFTWDGTQVTRQNLGTLTGSGASKATAINNAGLIVGSSTAANNAEHAFLYDESLDGPKMIDLHSPAPALAGMSSYALAINDSAWVVGRLTSGGSELAFLWTPGSGMVLLQDLIDPHQANGWRLSAATGINSHGQIVGYGTLSNGATHAFVLTPNGGPIVPEPSSILLLTLGLATCGLSARRRRPC